MTDRSDIEYDPEVGNKFIFVTGGVMSGLGKGITAASIGRLLRDSGLDVTAVKVDPYLNVDAGTMNPFEHGEVYVLRDGAEVDLDLGNYERFLDIEATAENNITTGKVYRNVIENERAGDYLGKTVQIIPHVTDEIKHQIRTVADGYDVCIVEVGGTIGDIEGMPYVEALRQFEQEQDDDDHFHIHVTLVPYAPNGEQKTKPTQHSVKELRSTGLEPDAIVGRCSDHLQPEIQEKIAMFCDVPTEAVFSNPDVDDIYHVPLKLAEEGVDEYISTNLGIETSERTPEWRQLVEEDCTDEVEIALVGKYPMDDAYLSVRESVKHAGLELGVDTDIRWVTSEDVREENADVLLGESDGIIVPGGFGSRGLDGKIATARYARENDVPFLGLCLGFQMAVVEYARHAAGFEDAHSAEVSDDTPHPVIDILPEQKELNDMGGTMRLGAHETKIEPGTIAHELYGDDSCVERHRHRYEVNPEYITSLEDAGLTFSGVAGKRMEILELEDHPYFLGTQFHPEFTSRPGDPSPPFVGLLRVANDRK